jgi:hypothetical protein
MEGYITPGHSSPESEKPDATPKVKKAQAQVGQSVCPVQAAPDKGSSLVKLRPAGDS